MTQRIKLWDLPTRLFHWLLALLVIAAIITGKLGGNAIVWHGRIGLALVGLLTFRILWGFLGSTHARFVSFFPTPTRLVAYLRGQWHGIGHNPLGAFSVFGLLALISLQLGSGLFANDDIAFQGHLSALVDKDLSDRLTSLHRLLINALIILICLHLAAIMFYAHVKKDNLVKPMITGWKEIAADSAERITGGGMIALIVAVTVAGAAVYGASGQWISAPPPPPQATPATPAW